MKNLAVFCLFVLIAALATAATAFVLDEPFYGREGRMMFNMFPERDARAMSPWSYAAKSSAGRGRFNF